MRVDGLLLLLLASCAASQSYSYMDEHGTETEMAPVEARVVSASEADGSGLTARTLAIPFDGDANGTQLVQEFLRRADSAGAYIVADLAIYLQTARDGARVECRSSIVPESVTESHTRPSRYEQVSVPRPVTRTVTELAYQCKPVTKFETRLHTEYQQRCSSVSRPVTRTRTVYRSEYSWSTKSTRSVPHTETYTTYESRYECKSEPTTRSRMESVTRTECSSQPVTRTVTRYEFQLESRFVPAQLETITRQRLRELTPECYDTGPSDGPPSTARAHRIEGRIFTKPTSRRTQSRR